MTHTPTHLQAKHDETTPSAAAEIRALTRVRGLADLFDRRPELAGVHPPADLTAEAVRWSA